MFHDELFRSSVHVHPPMGDLRFDRAYDAIARSKDPAATIRDMTDAEVVHALAAASRKMDSYLANVLAEEALRRQRRQRAMLWGAIVGLASAVTLRTALLLAYAPGSLILMLGSIALVPAAIIGYVAYRAILAVSRRRARYASR